MTAGRARSVDSAARIVCEVVEVVVEITSSSQTERGASRADDKISEAAVEDHKREG